MTKTLALASLAGLCGLTACTGGSPSAAEPQATSTLAPMQQTQQQCFPGANGLLAAIEGTTLQVQSESEQTAVTYSAKTAFTQQVPATAAAVTVGSCVMVRDASAAPPDLSSTAPPTAAPTQASAVTATSVQVSAPVSGSCTGAAGGLGGPPGGLTGPGGRPGSGATPPPGFTPPTDGNGRAVAVGGGAFGTVVSTTASGFVVESTRPGESETSTVAVTTTAGTTYSTEKKAAASALRVGQCVAARGTADSSGTVAATSIAIRPATNGSCTMGFRRG